MFRRVNRWLGARTGYHIAKDGQRGLAEELVNDPRLAGYHDPGLGRGCIVFAPTELGLGFNAFVLGPKSYHPWIVAVRAAGNCIDRDSITAQLEAYYSLVKPASLGKWLDISTDACPQLASLPLHAWSVLPWTTGDPGKIIREIEAAQLEENRRYGLDEGMSAGAKAFGPVSGNKVRVEAERICSLFKSLQRYGLDHSRADYNLRATFLVTDCRWTWLSMGGMHRVAMAAAAGITRVPVRVAAIVRRNEVEIWPQVVSGLYDPDTALGLFDRLFNLRPPTCTRLWLDWVDKYRSAPGPL